ncbi:MAG: UDP-glucose/GDP-mannose dehydrogenase family protein [Phycisphaerae bacterium]|nr:UDP-glucose/GDP-mannose dehydrogenase family protein [Phycisphaerae bacterium]
MKVCVVGVGYVGLVTAACLAEAGNHVVCVDTDDRKVKALENGEIPIYEPGLTEIVQHNIKLNRLTFTTDLSSGVEQALIVFLAVGTPSSPDGSADISAVKNVAADIADCMDDYRIIVTKSTVPIGTCEVVSDIIRSRTEMPFDYVSNPEFLKEGAAVEDFMSPDRIIIGTNNPAVREIMKQLYGPFMRRNNRILFMDPISAELSKYAANTMLATRISFMNEIAALCDAVGADVELVRSGLGSDSRIGGSFLFPGVGYGGSCFPKDVRALIHTGQENGIDMTIARAAKDANQTQHDRFAQRILDHFAGQEQDTVLAVWGLAFKAKTDDIREAPALYCIKRFLEVGIHIKAYDPEAAEATKQELGDRIEIVENGYDALDAADALVIFTDWQEFRNPDLEAIAKKLKNRLVFDGRNLYDLDVMRKVGFEYHSIGRACVTPERIRA